MKDFSHYLQTVSSRLKSSFVMDDFALEDEALFWATAADMAAFTEPVSFLQIVEWLDGPYKSLLHAFYLLDSPNLDLTYKQVLTRNLDHFSKLSEDSFQNLSSRQKNEYMAGIEDQLSNLERQFPFDPKYLIDNQTDLSIGKCLLIPLFKNRELWGFYVIGPFVQHPAVLVSKIGILSKLLSKWLVEIVDTENKKSGSFIQGIKKDLPKLNFNTAGNQDILEFILNYYQAISQADMGFIAELTAGDWIIRAESGVPANLKNARTSVLNPGLMTYDTNAKTWKVNDATIISEAGLTDIFIRFNHFTSSISFLVLGKKKSVLQYRNLLDSQVSFDINEAASSVIKVKESLKSLNDTVLEFFYRLILAWENRKGNQSGHTRRVMALVSLLSDRMELKPEEKQIAVTTARFHDIGLVAYATLNRKVTTEAELEHPVLGSLILEMMGSDPLISAGIKSHHEWINGGGMPEGLKGDDIPWTGKLVSICEYLSEYVENHENDSTSDSEKIQSLVNELNRRAGKQFEKFLVSELIAVTNKSDWKSLSELGKP